MKKHYYAATILFCTLLLLLTACSTPGGSSSNSNITPTPTTTHNGGHTPTPSGNGSGNGNSAGTPTTQTVAMPQTSTACPATGTARAAVMRTLALGSHQNLVYIYNEVPQNTSIAFGHLRRFDARTGQKVDIATSGIRIEQAQVSADGQWVLFLSIPDPRGNTQSSAMLQLVRMDGQGLQTLYCFPNVTYSGHGVNTRLPISLQWSVDEKSILVSVNTNDTTSQIFMINVASGAIHQLFLDQQDTSYYYSVVTWLDNARFYVLKIHQPTTSKPDAQTIFLMNASTATVANPGLMQVLVSNTSLTFFSVDSSYDGTQLFSASCLFQSGSTITTEPATGGTAQTLLRNDPTDCVSTLRAPSANTLLLLVDVFNATWNAYSPQVWTMSPTSGSMHTLTTLSPPSGNEAGYSMNNSSQLPWSNVSRDGGTYALISPVSSSSTQSILIGSLSGGNTTAIATTNSGLSTVSLAGWTTM